VLAEFRVGFHLFVELGAEFRNLSAERRHFDAVRIDETLIARGHDLVGLALVIFRARQRLRFFVGIAAAGHAIADLFVGLLHLDPEGRRREHEHDVAPVDFDLPPHGDLAFADHVQTTLETIDPARFHVVVVEADLQTAAEDRERFDAPMRRRSVERLQPDLGSHRRALEVVDQADELLAVVDAHHRATRRERLRENAVAFDFDVGHRNGNDNVLIPARPGNLPQTFADITGRFAGGKEPVDHKIDAVSLKPRVRHLGDVPRQSWSWEKCDFAPDPVECLLPG